MFLSSEQRLGATILFTLALIAWVMAVFYQSSRYPSPGTPTPSKRSWAQRKDSIRRADSLRYVQWREERQARYDSFLLADSIRHAEWRQIRQQRYDSFRREDSLWRDSVGWRLAPKQAIDTVMDLNRCDTVQLQRLRGIGPFTARTIIRYRDQLGGYYSPAQLTDEPLAALHLDTLLYRFTADNACIQKIPVNSCSADRLQQHPYLRYHQAKAIYSLRRKNVRLRSIDELRAIPELSPDDLSRLAPYLSFE